MIPLFTIVLLMVSATAQFNNNPRQSAGNAAPLESFWWQQSKYENPTVPKEVHSNPPHGNNKNAKLLEENTACKTGFDCVSKLICVDGVISTDGGGLITTRIKASSCTGDNVCCRIPGYIEPLGPDQCRFNEDCVSAKICSPEGVIDVSGAGLITLRTASAAPSTCINHELPNDSAVCCLRPYKCPEFKECVPNNHCGVNGQIDRSGNLKSYIQNGIKCRSDGQQNDGVCCTLGPEIRDVLPAPVGCGVRNDKNLSKHVNTGYGKEDASFGEFPWQAIIFLASDKDDFLYSCAGTLISDRHVLTVAHCVEFFQPRDIRVRLGEYELGSEKELIPYTNLDVKSITVHPQFNHIKFNLAIVELKQPVEYKYHINPICLPKQRNQFSSKCVASGWGKDNFQGSFQHILKKLDLPYVNRRRCRNLLRRTSLGRSYKLHRSVACAGGEEGKDTCTGDGGGPLACLDENTGRYYLGGIVVGGIQCGVKDVPGLYTDIPFMSDWISRVTGLTI